MLFRVRRGTSPSTPGDYTKVAGGLRPPHFSAPSCIPPNCCPGPCPPLRGQAALLAPGTSHRAAPAPWSRHMWLDAWLATQLPAWLSGCWACCGPPTPFRTFPSCACRPQWTLAATGTPAGRADEAGAQAGKSGALTSQTVGTSFLRVAWGKEVPTVGGSGWAGWGYFCLSTNSWGWLWPLSSKRLAGN